MRLSFSRRQRPHTLYVLKSFRDETGKSTTKRVETLGSEEEIEKKYGCPDGLVWAKNHVELLNEEERRNKKKIKVELSPTERINIGEQVSYDCGDLLLLPLYNGLGLPGVCEGIVAGTKVKYNLNEILEMLVMLRILCPCSKLSSYELGKKRMRRLTCALEDVYKALSLLSSHIDDIQAAVWENSQKILSRNTRVIWLDSNASEGFAGYRQAAGRDISEIPMCEIENVVIETIKEQFSIDRESIKLIAARKLGFSRRGAKVDSALSQAVDNLVIARKVTETGGKISLIE